MLELLVMRGFWYMDLIRAAKSYYGSIWDGDGGHDNGWVGIPVILALASIGADCEEEFFEDGCETCWGQVAFATQDFIDYHQPHDGTDNSASILKAPLRLVSISPGAGAGGTDRCVFTVSQTASTALRYNILAHRLGELDGSYDYTGVEVGRMVGTEWHGGGVTAGNDYWVDMDDATGMVVGKDYSPLFYKEDFDVGDVYFVPGSARETGDWNGYTGGPSADYIGVSKSIEIAYLGLTLGLSGQYWDPLYAHVRYMQDDASNAAPGPKFQKHTEGGAQARSNDLRHRRGAQSFCGVGSCFGDHDSQRRRHHSGAGRSSGHRGRGRGLGHCGDGIWRRIFRLP